MVYLTGDTHGGCDILKLHKASWPEQLELTRKDYLIILGDFGGVWSKNDTELLGILDAKPFTTLFIDGNHENFDLLYGYKKDEWCGGEVRKITPNILHLTRGQIFNINGNKFFTMGGALSIDKEGRRRGISWWPEEIPNYKEVDTGIANLEKVGFNVDYILSHACPTHMAKYLHMTEYEDPTCKILDEIERLVNFKMWYFGHYHLDVRRGKFRGMFDRVLALGV